MEPAYAEEAKDSYMRYFYVRLHVSNPAFPSLHSCLANRPCLRVVVISFVRIYSLKPVRGETADPTCEFIFDLSNPSPTKPNPADDDVDGLIWTVAEPAVGLICACLPVLRPLFTTVARNKRSSKPRQKPWLAREEWQQIHRDDTTAVNDSQQSGGSTFLHTACSGSQETEVSYAMNEMRAAEEGRK